jgi:hypothetical protein
MSYHHILCLANLAIGNILPVGQIPEGTVICNIEAKINDCAKLARASGDYAIIVAQDPDKGTAFDHLGICVSKHRWVFRCHSSEIAIRIKENHFINVSGYDWISCWWRTY